MILIYGNAKVGQAIGGLCDHMNIRYDIRDYNDPPLSYDAYEAIVPSPGVPGHHPLYATGKVVSELDFAYRYLPKGFQIISITGTDGKSTTSWIMYSVLQREYFGKKSVYLSGNFDIPFSATVLEILKKGEKKGIIVVEVSSFMAYSLKVFTSHYSIFTNFKPDHLNWHKDLQDYFLAKMHVFSRTKNLAVINQQVLDFAYENHLIFEQKDNVRIFEKFEKDGMQKKNEGIIRDFTDGEKIVISGRNKYLLSETHFSGMHNAMNILSVGLVTNAMKICSKRIKKYLSEIQGLPHRLEKIGEKNGLIFVEDSKSTSSQSLEAALGSYGSTKNLLLIVGGSDKGDSFDYLSDILYSRVKALACIGETKDRFISLAKGRNIPFIPTDSLDEGVTWLYEKGEKGDVLMLSPGCASFGLFRDYLDRACQFRAIVKKLSE